MYWPLRAEYEPPDSLLAIHALADELEPDVEVEVEVDVLVEAWFDVE